MNDIDDWKNTVHVGDCLDRLEQMPDNSVHSVIFSPPYYGLRDYDGGERELGQEETLDDYIANMVEVGEKIKRVLRDDGSWWLNLGDTYSGGGGNQGVPDDWDSISTSSGTDHYPDNPSARDTIFKEKTKMFVPHRTAIALTDAGWTPRNDAVWRKKGGGMPESIKDRLSKTFEFVFHFVQQKDYWYDLDAIREPYSQSFRRQARSKFESKHGKMSTDDAPGHNDGGINDPDTTYDDFMHAEGKNPGDLFVLPTASYPDAHFATYPEELVETPLKATCPPKVCPACGTPYERVTDQLSGSTANIDGNMSERGVTRTTEGLKKKSEEETRYKAILKGWEPDCDCDAGDPEPGVVLDPFMGAGTTGVVAQKHQRWWVGIELNDEYAEMAEDRIQDVRHNNPDPDAEGVLQDYS